MKSNRAMIAILMVLMTFFAFQIVGCGSMEGGEAETTDTTGDGSTTAINISLQLVDASTGTTTNTITTGSPGELRITVTDSTGSPISNLFLEATSTKGILNPADGTAITNSSGIATIGLLAGSDGGAGTVTATIGSDSAELGFQIGTVDIRMGAFINGTFVENEMLLSIASGVQLAPGSTATITVSLVDSSDNLYTTPVDISFYSDCSNAGLAELDGTVTTINGSATATYRAKGCVGTDTITATAVTSGNSLVATGTIDVAAAAVGSIGFVSATPENIALSGTGGAGRSETSSVVFKVTDENGNPASSVDVDFSLTTAIGGIELEVTNAISDSNGLVQTVLNSGNVPTHVRVNATVTGSSPLITTVSDQLVISTGLPDQNSFSISAEVLNPEAWNYDGVEVEITIRTADHFNNPVPNGTTIYFTTEGGSIDPFCQTTDGGCSVTWRSQAPRPSSDGRITILATSIGEESFIDENGDGLFNSTDSLLTDLPEAYRDEDEDGIFDSGIEEFFDFDKDLSYDIADGKYNGTLCSAAAEAAGDCTKDFVHVRDSIVLVMSGSTAYISFSQASIDFTLGTIQTVFITIQDLHGQPMPADTEISLKSGVGEVGGNASFDIPSTNINGPLVYGVALIGPTPPTGKAGVFEVNVTTPKGLIGWAYIPVQD